MLLALLTGQTSSTAAILSDTWSKLDRARSLSVTQVKTTEEFGHASRVKYAWKTGGYFRAETDRVIDLSSPVKGWTYMPGDKSYIVRTPLTADFKLIPTLGMTIFKPELPIVGAPKAVIWHGRHAMRIELDGRKAMTKETKLFVFVDPKTHLPVGVSMNLGSVTQVVIYEDLKIDPKLDDSLFHFTAPKSWTEVKASPDG